MVLTFTEAKFGNLNITNELKKSFKKITKYTWEDFDYIDSANRLSENIEDKNASNKHFFYNDILLGLMDSTVDLEYRKVYADKIEKIKRISKKNSKYSYIFQTQEKLVSVIESKVTIGVELRKAYREDDREKINSIMIRLKKLIKKIDGFYDSFNKQWNKENKVYGFDVQDLRIGGLKQRINVAINRLHDYLSGKTNKIEELEVELLDYYGKRKNFQKLKDQIEYKYRPIVTVNVNE